MFARNDHVTVNGQTARVTSVLRRWFSEPLVVVQFPNLATALVPASEVKRYNPTYQHLTLIVEDPRNR